MGAEELQRLKELTQKVGDAGGDLYALTLEEGRELMRLLLRWGSKEEFGYPIKGEEG